MVQTKAKKPELPQCDGCGEPIAVDEPCYQVRSGYIDEDGDFVRTDEVGQLFHLGRCLNSEE